jgi:Asp-tRNA(Asn)/Glu-tRNA(Gln) amidotransferase A subunit family amidase
MSIPWSHSGLPTVTFCTGHVTGASPVPLPLAVTIAGRFGRDEQLLCFAEGLEKAVGVESRAQLPADREAKRS